MVFPWSASVGVLLSGLGWSWEFGRGGVDLYMYFYCDVRKDMVLGGVTRLDVILGLFLLCKYSLQYLLSALFEKG